MRTTWFGSRDLLHTRGTVMAGLLVFVAHRATASRGTRGHCGHRHPKDLLQRHTE